MTFGFELSPVTRVPVFSAVSAPSFSAGKKLALRFNTWPRAKAGDPSRMAILPLGDVEKPLLGMTLGSKEKREDIACLPTAGNARSALACWNASTAANEAAADITKGRSAWRAISLTEGGRRRKKRL